MTDDLVKRLANAGNGGSIVPNPKLCRDAHSRIEADAATIADLRAENERLRAERDVARERLAKMKTGFRKEMAQHEVVKRELTAMTANADALAKAGVNLDVLHGSFGKVRLAWQSALAHHNQLRKEG